MKTSAARQHRLPILALGSCACLLAACGGGDPPGSVPAQADRHALAAAATTLDATALFNWAERTFPTLFPAGPPNEALDYDGRHYTIRYYPGVNNYLGVAGEAVYGLGGFTGQALLGLGTLSDWSCQVLGQTCLSGTAARALGLAAAVVQARCSQGSASTTAAADGSYTLVIDGGSLPCVLRASAADGSVLHAVAAGSGNGSRSRVHITPMTDLVTAHLAGGPPAALFGAFAAADAARFGAAAVLAANDAAVAAIRTAGVDFSAVGNLMEAALVPGADGNAHGQALAQLVSRLTGSLSQATLADAVARSTPEARAAGTPSLPADLWLLPAAPNCSALRSGIYRAVLSDLVYGHAVLTIDAPALAVSTSLGASWVATPLGKCHYKQADGQEWVVTDAGVIVGRAATSSLRGMVAFPEQHHTLATMAGSWDSMILEPTSSDGAVHSSTATVGSDGWITALTYCNKDAGKQARDCSVLTSPANGLQPIFLAASNDGGFVLTNTATRHTQRSFVYRTGSGDVMAATGGELQLATLSRPAALPAAGQASDTWTTAITPQLTTELALTEGRTTVTAVDSAGGTWTRSSLVDAASGATLTERLEADRFRRGYVHRIGETVVASDGSTRVVTESVAIGLRGTGLTAACLLGSPQSFNLVVEKSTAP